MGLREELESRILLVMAVRDRKLRNQDIQGLKYFRVLRPLFTGRSAPSIANDRA